MHPTCSQYTAGAAADGTQGAPVGSTTANSDADALNAWMSTYGGGVVFLGLALQRNYCPAAVAGNDNQCSDLSLWSKLTFKPADPPAAVPPTNKVAPEDDFNIRMAVPTDSFGPDSHGLIRTAFSNTFPKEMNSVADNASPKEDKAVFATGYSAATGPGRSYSSNVFKLSYHSGATGPGLVDDVPLGYASSYKQPAPGGAADGEQQ